MELQPRLNLSLEDMPNEIWVAAKDYEKLYEVSSFGRVKSLPKTYLSTKGKAVNVEPRIIKQATQKGYLRVRLTNNTVKKMFFTHRLIISSFQNIVLPEKCHVCHKDNNPLNNKTSNLYIGDVISNTIDKYNSGTTKLKQEDVIAIKNSHCSFNELSKIYNVNPRHISKIKRGVRGKHITENAFL